MFGFGNKLRIGVDIGSHTIKMVAIEKSGKTCRVVHRLSREIYSGQQEWSPDGPKRGTIVPILVDMFREMKLQPKRMKNVRALVSGTQVAAKEVLAIPLDEREMQSAMVLEARKHIPLDGSETQVDYMVLGEDQKEPDKVRVILAATTKNLFDNLLESFNEIEVRPTIVDIEPLAIANSWLEYNELPEDGVVVLLNVGTKKTGITVLGRANMFFTRDIPVAGHTFTEDLMKNYGLKYHEAEKVKIEKGMNPDLEKVEGETGGLRLASKSAIDRFGDEVNRTLRYYVKETGQSYFTKFVLFGGGAALTDVQDYLNRKFNVTVEAYDPFGRMEVVATNGGGHPGMYAGAVGLAIRES